jgi:hypothetical protein
MPPSSCLFCSHANPAGSKFCNECGSPLHLNPCPECAAINDHEAPKCHQCGAPLPPRSVSPTPAAESATWPAGIASVPTEGLSTDPVPGLDSSALLEERLDTLRREIGNQAEAPLERCAAALPDSTPANVAPVNGTRALSPVPWAQRVPRLASAPHRLPSSRSQRILHAVVAGSLVVGIAASGYYLYGPPAQVDRWLSAFWPGALITHGSYLAATPTRSITQIGNPATPLSFSEPQETSNASSGVPAEKLAGAAPRPEPPASPVATGDLARSLDSDATPAQPHEATSESLGESRPSETLLSTGPAPASALSVPPVAAEAAAKHAMRAASRRADRPRTAESRSLPVSDARIPLPANATRAANAVAEGRGCSQGIAALGLCNPSLQDQAR